MIATCAAPLLGLGCSYSSGSPAFIPAQGSLPLPGWQSGWSGIVSWRLWKWSCSCSSRRWPSSKTAFALITWRSCYCWFAGLCLRKEHLKLSPVELALVAQTTHRSKVHPIMSPNPNYLLHPFHPKYSMWAIKANELLIFITINYYLVHTHQHQADLVNHSRRDFSRFLSGVSLFVPSTLGRAVLISWCGLSWVGVTFGKGETAWDS